MDEILKAVLTAVLPILVALLYRWLGIQQTAQAALAVNTAAERAAGAMYAGEVAGAPPRLSANAATYERIAVAAQRLGVTENQFNDMVAGERGKLLAADPNTSIPTGG